MIVWMQWVSSRTGEMTAFACENGRAISGARVPEGAKPAQEGVQRDPYCARLAASRSARPPVPGRSPASTPSSPKKAPSKAEKPRFLSPDPGPVGGSVTTPLLVGGRRASVRATIVDGPSLRGLYHVILTEPADAHSVGEIVPAYRRELERA